MIKFNYILDKIEKSEYINYPFPHLDIKNFLSDEHLKIIMNDDQIHFNNLDNDDELYKKLINNGWKIQGFPGCTNDWNKYKKQLYDKNKENKENIKEPVENIGITFRLHKYNNLFIKELIEFMNSEIFHETLKKKFNIVEETKIISAIQKNLSGYEISPHPDIRQKCLTYLLNINKNDDIKTLDCHTHLLEFKNDYKFIENFWHNNKNIERCWVPWNWCNSVKTMNENNSIIIFSPNDNPPTLHAIKLKYNHLKFQRTQIYGNLMYNRKNCIISNYKDLINHNN